MTTATQIPKKLPTSFEGLAAIMIPHVIEDDADYQSVAEIFNRLLLLPRRTAGQQKYLDTLELLIEAYDNAHPIDTSDLSGLDILRSLLRDHQMTASDLGRLLGNRTLGGKILRGERGLSKANMRTLGVHFKLDPGVFLD